MPDSVPFYRHRLERRQVTLSICARAGFAVPLNRSRLSVGLASPPTQLLMDVLTMPASAPADVHLGASAALPVTRQTRRARLPLC